MSNSTEPKIYRLFAVFLALTLVLLWCQTIRASSNVGLSQHETIDWQDVIEQTAENIDVTSRLLRGIAYANLGELPKSLQEFEIAGQEGYIDDVALFVLDKLRELRKTPNDLLLLNCAAFGSYAFGDLAASAEYFERIVKLDSQNIWARNFAAIVYGYLDEFDHALNHLREAVTIDPKNQYSHLLLSAVYKEKSQYLQAFYHYLQAPDAVKELRDNGIL